LLVSVLQGNKRNSNSIHYQHPAPYSRNKMDKHGRKTKTINQNKQEKVGWGWGYNRDIRVFTKQSLQCQRNFLSEFSHRHRQYQVLISRTEDFSSSITINCLRSGCKNS